MDIGSAVARHIATLAIAACALVAPLGSAWAQSYPDRSITLIVPWPPGGSTDRHLRTLAEIAGRNLGQTIVVQNQPGAGGTLGPGNMAQNAKPDGYTLAQFPMGMLRLPHMQKTAWNPLTDFTFIIGVSGYTFGFTVRADSPYRTFIDYIEAARKEPGKVNYGSTGTGTSPHLLVEEIARIVRQDDVRIRFEEMGTIPVGSTPAEFEAFIAAETTKWGKVIREAKVTAD